MWSPVMLIIFRETFLCVHIGTICGSPISSGIPVCVMFMIPEFEINVVAECEQKTILPVKVRE